MPRRSLALTACLLALAACGEQRPAGAAAPPPAKLEGMPETSAAAAPAAASTTPAPAVEERYAQERERWRLSLALTLPTLPGASAHKIRSACEVWLFQGFAPPGAEGFAAAAKAAHDRLIAESPVPADTAAASWYDERSVAGVRVGPWLSLSRSMGSFGGGAHPNSRIDGLVVEAETARALVLDEIVPPEKQAALRSALAAALRAGKGIAAGTPLTTDIQRDEDLPIPIPLLAADGARFVWNRYDIGSYAEGEFTATLPPEQAKAFLAVDPWQH